MKCIKKDDKIKRVTNIMAPVLIKQGWVYCPKKEWKTQGSIKDITQVVEKTIKTSKKGKNKKKTKSVEDLATSTQG